MSLPSYRDVQVSSFVNSAFLGAKVKCPVQAKAWNELSHRLAGRSRLPVSAISIQRQGDLDLVLRCMESEFNANREIVDNDTSGTDFRFHYQLSLSEAWILGLYEIFRAIRQRDVEGIQDPDAISNMKSFQAILADLELLRMPMAKYEITRDKSLKRPVAMRAVDSSGSANAVAIANYDKDDPARWHLMAAGMSPQGSNTWLALDHRTSTQKWIERLALSDQILTFGNEIVPAGVLEATKQAEA